MTAHHFFVEPNDVGEEIVTLTGAEAHHATRSLRVRVGEHITVADGSGRVVTAVVSTIADDVCAEIVRNQHCAPPRPAVVLYQALPKGEKFDEIVEKASEVGVSRIVPFVAQRSVVRWDARKRARLNARWSAIARSAAKQCRSPWIAQIDEIADTVDDVTFEAEVTVALHEEASQRLRDALPGDAPGTIAIVVGPEGGLADDEIEKFAALGALAVSLGPRVLRTELAGLVAASVIGYRYGNVG